MMGVHVFPIVAVLLYFVAAAWYVVRMIPGRDPRPGFGRMVLLVGFIFHVIFVIAHEFGQFTALESPPFGFAYTLSLVSCSMIALFLATEHRLNISGIGAGLVPLAGLFLLASGVLFHTTPATRLPVINDGWLVFHIGTTIVGHVAFGFAFAVSLVLLLQEWMLKTKSGGLSGRLPSLKLLDRLNSTLLYAGFVCMSIGVLSGFAYGLVHDIPFFGFNARVISSLLTLFVYAVLLTGRSFHGIRGRRGAWLSIAGFCTVVVSFVSMQVFSEGFHVH